MPEQPLLLADPRVRAVAWGESGEPLVDVRTLGLRTDDRLADPAGAFALLRRGVADRLLDAQAALPRGLRLLVVEGYRPPTLQRAYFDEYVAVLRAHAPELGDDELVVRASAYISPPEVAPHGTGGAVDLTLCTQDGVELDLGTPVNASPIESDGACSTAAPGLPAAARDARELLCAVLGGAGLVNYPTEWWHWSWGERYWAVTGGRSTTVYAPVDPSLEPPA